MKTTINPTITVELVEEWSSSNGEGYETLVQLSIKEDNVQFLLPSIEKNRLIEKLEKINNSEIGGRIDLISYHNFDESFTSCYLKKEDDGKILAEMEISLSGMTAWIGDVAVNISDIINKIENFL